MSDISRVIIELDQAFSNEDDVHSVDIKLDALASALADHLESVGQHVASYGLAELLQQAGIGDAAVTNLEQLRDYANQVDYEISLLDEDEVTDADQCRKKLCEEIKTWYEKLPHN